MRLLPLALAAALPGSCWSPRAAGMGAADPGRGLRRSRRRNDAIAQQKLKEAREKPRAAEQSRRANSSLWHQSRPFIPDYYLGLIAARKPAKPGKARSPPEGECSPTDSITPTPPQKRQEMAARPRPNTIAQQARKDSSVVAGPDARPSRRSHANRTPPPTTKPEDPAAAPSRPGPLGGDRNSPRRWKTGQGGAQGQPLRRTRGRPPDLARSVAGDRRPPASRPDTLKRPGRRWPRTRRRIASRAAPGTRSGRRNAGAAQSQIAGARRPRPAAPGAPPGSGTKVQKLQSPDPAGRGQIAAHRTGGRPAAVASDREAAGPPSSRRSRTAVQVPLASSYLACSNAALSQLSRLARRTAAPAPARRGSRRKRAQAAAPERLHRADRQFISPRILELLPALARADPGGGAARDGRAPAAPPRPGLQAVDCRHREGLHPLGVVVADVELHLGEDEAPAPGHVPLVVARGKRIWSGTLLGLPLEADAVIGVEPGTGPDGDARRRPCW